MTAIDEVNGRAVATDPPPWGTPPPTPIPSPTDVEGPTDLDEHGGLRAGDEPKDEKPPPVDQHLIPVKPERARRADPQVPAWLTDPRVAREMLDRGLRLAGKRGLVGAIRTPGFLGLLAWWLVRGVLIAVGRVTAWLYDVDDHPLVGEVTAGSDTRIYLTMRKIRRDAQKFRWKVSAALTVLAVVVVTVTWQTEPGVTVALSLAALALLVYVGKPEDRKLLSPSVTKSVVPRLTNQNITRALSSLPNMPGLAKSLTQDSASLWRSAIVAIRGGHKVWIQLPGSLKAADLVQHEQGLASALGRPADCVIIEPMPHVTPGDFTMYVFDKPVLSGKPAAWPLASKKAVSLFDPLPLGVDRIGRPYRLSLIEQNVFTGGIPGSGKSALVRVIAGAAALDPLATLTIINLKGTPDFLALQPICHRYLSANPDMNGGQVRRLTLAVLEEVAADLGRRADLLTEAAKRGKAPDSKITRELAQRVRGLRPWVIIIDEAHRMFDGPADVAAKAEELLVQIVRLGRAHGVCLVLATQLGDADSVPPEILRMASVRMCMRVNDHIALNQLLGAGASRTVGVPSDYTPGTGLVRTATGTVKVRSYYLDGSALADIGKRAHDVRSGMHVLTGQAAGEQLDTPPQVDRTALLRDVLDVFGDAAPVGDQEAAWTGGADGLAALLVTRLPDVYAGRADGWLNTELRARGVAVEPVGRRWTDDGEQAQRTGAGVRADEVRRVLAILLSDESQDR